MPQGQVYQRNRQHLRMASNTKDETYDDFIDDDIVNENHDVETDTNRQDSLPQNPPTLPPDTLRRSKRTIRKPARYSDSGY